MPSEESMLASVTGPRPGGGNVISDEHHIAQQRRQGRVVDLQRIAISEVEEDVAVGLRCKRSGGGEGAYTEVQQADRIDIVLKIGDAIRTVALRKNERVLPKAADKRVGAASARQDVISVVTPNVIVTTIAHRPSLNADPIRFSMLS